MEFNSSLFSSDVKNPLGISIIYKESMYCPSFLPVLLTIIKVFRLASGLVSTFLRTLAISPYIFKVWLWILLLSVTFEGHKLISLAFLHDLPDIMLKIYGICFWLSIKVKCYG